MFYRILPLKDSFITNISTDLTKTNLATGSNLGSSPTLQVFAIKDRLSTGSVEWARTLVQFDVVDLSRSIFIDKTVPSSSVSYILRMPNFVHGGTIPTSFELYAYPLSRSWTEGTGSDSSGWRDYGWVNWLSASSTVAWSATGSDFLTSNYGSGSQLFDRGQEDLEMDVTAVVNNWLTSSIGAAGGLPNNGLVIKLGTTEENNQTTYSTKMFHGRESKFVDRIPYIEARWDADVLRDNRNNFAYNQWNKLYFYNYVRGQLTGASEPIMVQIKDHPLNVSASYNVFVTASRVEYGIYSASLYVNNFTASFSSSWVDIWGSGTVSGSSLITASIYMTGTFIPIFLSGATVNPYEDFVVDTDLRQEYMTSEQARIQVTVRKKNLKKSHIRIVHTGSTNIDREYVQEMYYSVVDHNNNIIVPFGTGSTQFTRLSYDGNGNYFDMFFNGFVPGFMYRLKFMIVDNKSKKIFDEDYKFKVI